MNLYRLWSHLESLNNEHRNTNLWMRNAHGAGAWLFSYFNLMRFCLNTISQKCQSPIQKQENSIWNFKYSKKTFYQAIEIAQFNSRCIMYTCIVCTMYYTKDRLEQAFFWTFAQKLKTQEFFAQNSKFRQFFQKFKKIFTKLFKFYLKSGKIVQKLKNLPKTQGKISKNLKFPANPLSSNAGKTSKKRACITA